MSRLTLSLLLAATIHASELQAEDRPPLVVPSGAKISLTPFKEKWLLGENILLYYEVKNTGSAPFQVDSGGDYRGGTRAFRFKVAAYDAEGKLQSDPSPFQWHMGGLGGAKEIKPGESWFGNVPLMRYRNLPAPGRYTIRVAHDLGWQGEPVEVVQTLGEVNADPRWLETTIEVAMPTEEEAAKLLVETLDTKDPGGTFGHKRDPYPDFTSLRYPIYLPLLMKLSRAHHLEAVEAIASQFTPESTSALIELLFLADDAGTRHGNNAIAKERRSTYFDENESVAEAAALQIAERVPDPLLAAGDKVAYGWDENLRQQRLRRIADSWRPKHADSVRRYARQLLESPIGRISHSGKRDALRLLQGVGTKDDYPLIVQELERFLKHQQEFAAFRASIPPPANVSWDDSLLYSLQRTIRAMQIEPAESPQTPAEIVIYLEQLRGSEKHPPASFTKLGPEWLQHEYYFIRQSTLELLPRPIPDWAKSELAELAVSPDDGVRRYATVAIRDAADPQFRGLMLQRISKEHNVDLMSTLNSAAQAVGVPRDKLLEAWARRLNEVVYDRTSQRFGMGAKSFEMLHTNVIENEGGYGWCGTQSGKGSETLKRRWLSFINANRAALIAGRKFRVGDLELTEDLFPVGANITHEGKMWPPEQPQVPPQEAQE